MKNILLFLLTTTLFFAQSFAQKPNNDSTLLLTFNQQIDNDVVAKNLIALDKAYAEDFVFSHGSGKVEGKKGWLSSVVKGGFVGRLHDSVKVELHTDIAIVKGLMHIQKRIKDNLDRYHLKYIRVFALRNKNWVLISHNTTAEVHDAI